jgi:UDP-N-acetylmuramoyl-tripeptide--D-alanyl-D-alanine ligase
MNAVWTSAEAKAATLGIETRAFEVTGLSIDTRTLKPGDLFVALKGDARDGHDFVRAAFDAKAGAALVTHAPVDVANDSALLLVANTLRGLEDLARASRARSRAKIVAVTGSVGKTTTKEMLRLAFGALGATWASAASYNNHWGVPLSIASMPRTTEFGVFEVGMNHFGEIRALAGFVRPHIALVTTIAPAHLEFFGTCEAIVDAKSEIFEAVLPGGTALIPSDSPYAGRLMARAKQCGVGRILTFGSAPGSDACLVAMSESGEGMKIEADVLGRNTQFRIGAPGNHIARNALGAMLAVAALDGDIPNAGAALASFSALKGRGARFSIAVGGGTATIIDESYNANPASMAAALELLGSTEPGKGGRRIAVLGDMLEMGPEGEALHAALARDIEAANADLVFANGTQMSALWSAIPMSRKGAYATSSRDIVEQVAREVRAGDVLLVKGSLGSKMAVFIDALKTRAV